MLMLIDFVRGNCQSNWHLQKASCFSGMESKFMLWTLNYYIIIIEHNAPVII